MTDAERRAHFLKVADSFRMAAVFARGDAASWKAEHQLQMSIDADYDRGSPSAETMRCKGAIDALMGFACRMDQKKCEFEERAAALEKAAAGEGQ